ncbi:Glutamyl-tRNA synthetase, Glutamyl-tRNA(Gln) synthetase [Pseudonocardia sp. Ae168_Ps1]|uniref:glutamate--tRNA ligase n=1 Tax=unclassified Pseudonocardia TaxID=2619320 RepID=UPI00094AAB95|nr:MULTISPECIES: glutamate--tRNA ligase [unclassified Pseudonocardia]OLL73659.1 Glutamyl-tRNA synthetase Glutamyl-tRNA(Gln) synthetase [Pseudonocardia sp. Ae150A_Ps1]OLL79635.1 Glutamyl-tRNA synthetase, Glutamyl-tRNA(Gln) synthetase [Pseudonocardia sp. Ae168_Ps1]OLL86227.1 Glutamyl-tRNA synthetase, Glutamyl-tRNA(Gln) synthetase [Pseudonocardia sp. Ae263_Ps1]OLL93742.1 Glutamyl-tRNA synthetase, Glutamyl-tRNA(Gln) synthetase [Pseudonocardia sp. Ae356_Ps1]
MSTPAQVRVRFSPSPTGIPHVGLIRTALFNWAHARHHGGSLVFRIEDTDAQRDSTESYEALLDALTWLGLDWDEGVERGGPHGPYRQSERAEVYADALRRLIDGGEVYESFSSGEEIEARHRAAGRDPKLGYDNADRDLTDEQKQAFRDDGRTPVYRLRMPDRDITFTDLVRGEITFRAGQVPDFVLARGDGTPLYPLTNPVDDALMEITHVLRGEDLLASTPRQIALLEALARVGIGHGPFTYAHLPLVTGEGNRKLSKRDPQSNLFHYRDRGFVPEGLLNYLALLGWSIAEDRDVFSLQEMTEAFDVSRVSSNAARFDIKKAEAINAAHLRLLAPDDFAARVVPYLAAEGIEVTDADQELLAAAAPLVQERSQVLSDAARMLAFLFRDEDTFTPDEDAATKNLGADAAPVLEAAVAGLSSLEAWDAAVIEESLKTSLVDGLGLKPRKAFALVRVAISGRTVSPPLYESMELLGRERSLARLGAGVRRSQGMV